MSKYLIATPEGLANVRRFARDTRDAARAAALETSDAKDATERRDTARDQ
jgi:hypothetical protein